MKLTTYLNFNGSCEAAFNFYAEALEGEITAVNRFEGGPMPVPAGMEQKITYQIESAVCGSYISYSVTLRGWLSPFIWWWIKPYSDRVASELAQAAERLV